MKKAFIVPQETKDRQARAADPKSSVWVSANAGSGKTHVLSQRVVRLLLEGTDPSKILCLTYTRAAASNMANRVFRDLSAWTMLDEAALAGAIEALEGRKPDAARLGRARRLFARALETPGGLKIQTIHAFCEAVLHQFPLEANIAGHFELLDSQMEAALFAEARRDMITGASVPDSADLAEAFAAVLERAGESGLDDLLGEILRKRDGLRLFIDAIGDGGAGFGALFEEFGFAAGETADTVAGAIWPLPGFSPAAFAEFRQAAEAVGARRVLDSIVPDAGRAFAEADPIRRLGLLASGFLKSDGDPYSPATAFKKALLDRLPDLPERYLAAAQAIVEVSDRLALFRMLEATRAALVLADWLIGRYERMKSARGLLDFNDLITRTVRLLAREDAGAWVQYKLDQGIDHILLDEAQDTSPDQWQVVRKLAEEFFAGLGARDNVRRTIFAVGDEKQSIYSFQGADPSAFAESRHGFAIRVRDAEGSFEDVRLTWSFRSNDDVLTAVDRVFARDEVRKGLSQDMERLEHKAIRASASGYVEVWPSLGAEAVEEPDDWTAAIDHASAPAVRVAEQVAATIKGWIDTGETVGDAGRKLSAGDVMVLVRKRDRFVHALSRSLKDRGVAVAGADRLSLPGHIAVKDLIALGKCLLQPDDDLSLAAVLRSPIFGITEDELFTLAWDRGQASLAQSLRSQAGERWAGIERQLRAWGDEAAFSPVFEFYASVLGRDGVRRRMIARLGREAGDILDEFLNFCLAHEQVGQPGLEAFLATLESAGPEVKREMDQTRDEVRIMTVHAAKGLEAPVVFLVDSGSAPFSDQHLPRLMPVAMNPEGRSVRGYLWRAASDIANTRSRGLAARARELAEEEYRRLLYVGMTRAEDRLVVCGYHGKRQPSPLTWHAIVGAALAGQPETETRRHPGFDEPVHRFRVTPRRPAADAPPASDDHVPQRTASLPASLSLPLPPAPALPRPLSPSGASVLIDEDHEPVISGRSPVLDPDAEPGFAIRRGLAIHRLLQILPSIPVEERAVAGRRYLAAVAADWPDSERDSAWLAVERILGAPAFGALFSDRSRAEVSVMGTLVLKGRERAIAGKIDRLAVTDDAVLIADYKTNRVVPASVDAAPETYLLQLALYRALLQPLYPGRRVAAALVFTEVPELMPVPDRLLDDCLARLTQA